MQMCFMFSIYLLITWIYIICIHAQDNGNPSSVLIAPGKTSTASPISSIATGESSTITNAPTMTSTVTNKPKTIACENIAPTRLSTNNIISKSCEGNTCELQCQDGYGIETRTYGTQIITCKSDGQWSLITKCLEKRCNPSHTLDTRISCTKQNNYGSECTFRCDVGSYTEDDRVLSCDFHTDSNSVKWSNKMPTCKERLCPVLRLDSSSNTAPRYSCRQSSVGSKCVPRCTNGFEIASTTHSEYTCTASNDQSGASWMPPILNTRCTEESCYPSYSEDGGATCTKQNKYGSECTFICDVGSSTKDKKILSCEFHTNSVKWSNPMPKCKEIKCKRAEIPIAATGKRKPYFDETCSKEVNNDCTLHCTNGYEFSGGSTRETIRCSLTGEIAIWSPEISSIGDCQLKLVTHEKCQYWISNIEAKDSTAAAQQCKEKLGKESVLALIKTSSQRNYIFSEIKTIYGTSSYKYLIGASKDNKGKWTWDDGSDYVLPRYSASASSKCAVEELGVYYLRKTFPASCNHRYICEKPHVSRRADPCSTNPCINGVCSSYGCSYKCDCEDNFFGHRCERETRCVPPSYNDGEKTITCTNGRSIGSTCEIECARKYKFEGTSKTITCTKSSTMASWTSRKGKCTERLCPALTSDEFSNTAPRYSCRQSSVDSKCGISCINGFEIASTTHSEYTCTVSNDHVGALWVPSILNTRCTEKRCTPSYTSGTRITCTKQNKYGSECTFRCDAGSYTDDEKMLSCDFQTDSNLVKWSNKIPTCKDIKCEGFTYTNGKNEVSCPTTDLNSKCTIKCAENHKFEGITDFVICQQYSTKTAIWTKLSGECVEIKCRKAEIPKATSGQKNPSLIRTCSQEVGKVCTLHCGSGYEFPSLETLETIQCRLTGETATWFPEISSIGGCRVKLVIHEKCQYWISNIKAENKTAAAQQCKEKLGTHSVLALIKTFSQKSYINTERIKIYRTTINKAYLIGASKDEKGKWTWDDGSDYVLESSESASSKCAVSPLGVNYLRNTFSTSCNRRYICEKPQVSRSDPCSTNPCRNGVCSSYGCSYKCDCEDNFYGRHCESGPITVKFTNSYYQSSKGRKFLLHFTSTTNVVGEASLDLFVNGEKKKNFIISEEGKTSGASITKEYLTDNLIKDTYITARGMLQTLSGIANVYACIKISVSGVENTNDVNVTKDQCDGTKLLVTWNKLIGNASLNYSIHVGEGEEYNRYDAIHGQMSRLIPGLNPRTKYKIKVVPSIEGCKDNLSLFDEIEGETASKLPGAPTLVGIKIGRCVCNIAWNITIPIDKGHYKIRVSETARKLSRIMSQKGKKYIMLFENTTTSFEYQFETNPNSEYQIEIGTLPIQGCEGRVPIAWSNKTTGCSTNVASPKMVNTPAAPSIAGKENMVDITLNTVNERNGLVSCYFVVVKKLNSSKVNNPSEPITNISLLIQGNETIEIGESFVAIALRRFESEQTLVLGEEGTTCCDMTGSTNNCKNNTRRKRRSIESIINGINRELDPEAEYSHYILVSTPNSNGGDPMIAGSNFSAAWSVKKGPVPENKFDALVIVLPILLLLLLAGIVVVIFFYRRKYSKKRIHSVPAENIILQNRARLEDYSLSADEHIDIEQQGENPDDTVDRILAKYSVLLPNLYQAINDKRANEDMLFLEEFRTDIQSAIKACKLTTEMANLPANHPKNRYRNIVPYDHTRVELCKISGDEFSDYVNAAYIDGHNSPNKFIATQGPKPNTINDFWRMIWEQDCCVITVLTRMKENKKPKCAQYWSDDKKQMSSYGGITLSLVETINYGDYVRRKFKMSKNKEVREILQYQYIAWPDHGTPNTTSSILRFHKSVVSSQSSSAGPIVVHCSAGVGRTGTFIALDILSEQIYETEDINICAIVGKMRTRRPEMVQTLEQYIYLHKLVLELYQFGETDINVSDFSAVYTDTDKASGRMSKIDQEFAMLSYFLPLDTDQETGTKSANKTLNRDSTVIPYDHNVVMIQMTPADKNVPYYNASNISRYQNTGKLIAAQTPTSSSTDFFWRTVFDNHVSMIVSLCEKGESADYCFWPNKNEESKYGLVNVRTIEENSGMGCIERKFTLTVNDKTTNVSQIYYDQWSEDIAPTTSGTILEIIANIERHHQTLSDDKKVTLVHCSDGAGRTGAFCAISNLVERLKNENKVDVFRTVKDLRDQRPFMTRTVGHYEFCYQAVAEFLQSFELYGNFQ